MKKNLAIIALFSVFSAAFSCQVKIKNTSKNRVLVRDLNALSHYVPVGKESVNANRNPNERAYLKVVIGSQPYLVRQIACSDDHEITLSSSKIARGKAGKLFKITKVKK